jgi:hypothetical protein
MRASGPHGLRNRRLGEQFVAEGPQSADSVPRRLGKESCELDTMAQQDGSFLLQKCNS